MCNNLTKADSLHETLFIEAKLKTILRIGEEYRLRKAELKKQKNKQVLVFRLCDLPRWKGGDLLLFDSEHLLEVGEAITAGVTESGEQRMRYNKNRILIEPRKDGRSFIKLYAESEQKAIREKKITVVALKEKNKRGWMIVAAPKDIQLLVNERKKCQSNEDC